MYLNCSICSEKLDDGKKDKPDGYPVVLLSCSHVFHYCCVSVFFTSGKNAKIATNSSEWVSESRGRETSREQGSSGSAQGSMTGVCPFCNRLTDLSRVKRLYSSVDEAVRCKVEEEITDLKKQNAKLEDKSESFLAKTVDLEIKNKLLVAKLDVSIKIHAMEKNQLIDNFKMERKGLELHAITVYETVVRENCRLRAMLEVSQMEKAKVEKEYASLQQTVYKSQKLVSDHEAMIALPTDLLGNEREKSDEFAARLSGMLDGTEVSKRIVAATKRNLWIDSDDANEDNEIDSEWNSPQYDSASSSSSFSSGNRKCPKMMSQASSATEGGCQSTVFTDRDSDNGDGDDDEVQIIYHKLKTQR